MSFWNITYYVVMGAYLLFIAYILSDLFPALFMNPAVGFVAIGALGLLGIFKPWKEEQ
ncbi:MAG: hypothetical protein M1455_06280 [Actinobacteria bacterium]|nr:hypothetical protein [Actinomycetota bacterium]